MTQGIPAERLSDDDLRHELLQLKQKQDDIRRDGTDAQRANHASRTGELEAEFVRRFGSAAGDGEGREPLGEPDEARLAPGNDPSGRQEPGGAESARVAGSDW